MARKDTLRRHQYNGKVLWQTTEWLPTAISESTGFYAGKGVPEPEALEEARELMRQAQALLVKVGKGNDRKADQDFFTDTHLADAGIKA